MYKRQFLDGGNYYGLDKFSLDASFQDNSYLKTYMAYDMMAFMGVPAPLCSYTWVTVNGEDWGLFLAVEEPEEAFARRNFGKDVSKRQPSWFGVPEIAPDNRWRPADEKSLLCHIAVSYTHLDVYKRQAPMIPAFLL